MADDSGRARLVASLIPAASRCSALAAATVFNELALMIARSDDQAAPQCTGRAAVDELFTRLLPHAGA
jgi:hypothetical protein